MLVLFTASVVDFTVVDVIVVVDEKGRVTGAGVERRVVEGAVEELEKAGKGAEEVVEVPVISAAVLVMDSVVGAAVVVGVLVVDAVTVVLVESLVTILTLGMVVGAVRAISFVVQVFLGLKLVVVVVDFLTPFRHVPGNDFCQTHEIKYVKEH